MSKLTACLLTTALVGQTSATEPSLQEPASQAKLLLRADVAATLVLDGAPAGDVAAGEIRELRLLRGSHRVALVTQGGELRWQEQVELQEAQVVRLVELSARVAQHRADYVRIPAGSFAMGCAAGDAHCAEDERLGLRIGVRPFWIMRTEVTVAAYKAVMPALPPAPSFNENWARDAYPIVNVTWDDAAEYCARVGGRLPAEAEWEYAARGGGAARTYSWGDEPKPVLQGRKWANVADQRGHGAFDVAQGPWFEGYDDGYVYASPVFTFSPNGFELFDMTGNAREWCADWYDLGDPEPRTASGATRVLRGGSWNTGTTGARVSARFGLVPTATGPDVGVRCVRDVLTP